MTKEEILQEQIDAMEKLLKLKQAVVEELEKRVEKLENDLAMNRMFPGIFAPPPNQINIPSVFTVDPCPAGGSHDYPTMWGGTTPPPCNKCGKASSTNTFAVTCTDGTSQTTTK